MSLNLPTPFYNHTANNRVSGIPYVSSSIGVPVVSGEPEMVAFPQVTQRLFVSCSSGDVRVGFTRNGTMGVVNNGFILLNSDNPVQEFRVNTSRVYLLSSGSTTGQASISAELSPAPSKLIPPARYTSAYGGIIDTADVGAYVSIDDAVGSSEILNLPTEINGAPQNGLGLDAAGVYNTCGDFDGLNQAITWSTAITGGSTFSYDRCNDSDYSISVWIYPTAYPGDPSSNRATAPVVTAVVCNTNATLAGDFGFILYLGHDSAVDPDLAETGRIVFSPKHGATASYYVGTAGVIAQRNQWTHVGVTRSLTNGIIVYKNGVATTTDATYTESTTTASTANLQVGSQAATSLGGTPIPANFAFQGKIDEVMIVDRVITPVEMAAIYAAGA